MARAAVRPGGLRTDFPLTRGHDRRVMVLSHASMDCPLVLGTYHDRGCPGGAAVTEALDTTLDVSGDDRYCYECHELIRKGE